MSQSAVSIVIPAYNHADYLPEAIESVLRQDWPLELIVLDDGSTDGTRELLARYAGRCRCETQANMGQAATLNKGWSMASGEILGYLGADDLLRPGCVRAAVEALSAFPEIVLTYCDFDLIDARSRVLRTVRAGDFDYRTMVVELACLPGPGVFFRRSAFERAGGWDTALRQMPDYDYWIRLARFGDFRRIPRTLAAFRVHEASLTFATPPRYVDEPVRILENYFRLSGIPEPILASKAQALGNAFLFSAQLGLRSGRYGDAWRNVRRAASLYPLNLLRLSFVRRLAHGLFSRMGYRLIGLLRRAFGGRPA